MHYCEMMIPINWRYKQSPEDATKCLCKALSFNSNILVHAGKEETETMREVEIPKGKNTVEQAQRAET